MWSRESLGPEKPVEGCPAHFEDRGCGPGWRRSSWRERVCQRKVSRTPWLLRFAEKAKSEIMFPRGALGEH